MSDERIYLVCDDLHETNNPEPPKLTAEQEKEEEARFAAIMERHGIVAPSA